MADATPLPGISGTLPAGTPRTAVTYPAQRIRLEVTERPVITDGVQTGTEVVEEATWRVRWNRTLNTQVVVIDDEGKEWNVVGYEMRGRREFMDLLCRRTPGPAEHPVSVVTGDVPTVPIRPEPEVPVDVIWPPPFHLRADFDTNPYPAALGNNLAIPMFHGWGAISNYFSGSGGTRGRCWGYVYPTGVVGSNLYALVWDSNENLDVGNLPANTEVAHYYFSVPSYANDFVSYATLSTGIHQYYGEHVDTDHQSLEDRIPGAITSITTQYNIKLASLNNELFKATVQSTQQANVNEQVEYGPFHEDLIEHSSTTTFGGVEYRTYRSFDGFPLIGLSQVLNPNAGIGHVAVTASHNARSAQGNAVIVGVKAFIDVSYSAP